MDPLDRRAKLHGGFKRAGSRGQSPGDSYPRGEGALLPCSLTAGAVRPRFLISRDGHSPYCQDHQARGGFSMARRANATPALALLSFCPIHRLKELTEFEGRFHYGVNRMRVSAPRTGPLGFH